ncbi:MAG TPA: rod shape-determining protein MreC [Anaerolineales bacterium]|nr:rod shape-determining protein MreC [Anaerolineales bacterium]
MKQEDVMLALRYWGLGMAGCGLLLGFSQLGTLNPMRGVVEQRLWAIEKQVVMVRQVVGKPFMAIVGIFDRQARIAELEEQLALAAVDQQKLKQLEAAITLEQLTQHRASALAELYVKDDLSVVGAGEIHGILAGMAVTDKHGVLVGKIELVGRYVSRVERVGSIGFRIPAQTVSGGAKGVVYFDGTKVVFGEVLQTEQLEVGEIVVTGGVGGVLPTGLAIGQVVAIEGREADVTKTGVLKLLFQDEGWVAIW